MATLFVYDDASKQFVRRTTNLKKENGDRAVGTQLAADHPAQAVVRKGEAYKGPAMLFSQRYYTAYYPIFDSAGKTIGLLFVGIPMAQLDGMLNHAMIDDGDRGLLRRAADPDGDHAGGQPRHQAAEIGHRLDHRDRRRRSRRARASPRASRRDRRHRPHHPRVPQQRHRAQAARGREAPATRRRAAEQRKADQARFVAEFQAAVGGVIDNLMGSSRQFEQVAGRLTETARSTASLSGQSADASEQASQHVRSAATASDELAVVDRRDQPPGARIEQHRRRRGEAGHRDQPADDRAVRGRRSASATWSS